MASSELLATSQFGLEGLHRGSGGRERGGRRWAGPLVVGALLGGLVGVVAVRSGPLSSTEVHGSDWAPRAVAPVRLNAERGRFIQSYAMADSDWFWSFVDARRSFRGVVDPVLGWRMASDAGRGPLNVVGGHRVSYQPSGPTVTVWWFGGSTMFGLVQRDDHTIPSEVARLAERDGIRIRSVNFGVEGYNAMQEALAFGLALGGDRGSAAPPDLAVFYDGANELATAVERVDVGRTDPDDVYFQAVSEDERAARGTSRRTAALSPDERTALTVDLGAAQYRRAAAIVTDLARGADVPVVHLWQPLLATTARQGFEAPLLDVLDVDPDGLSQVRSVYDRMRSSSGVDPVDLSDAMTGATGPTFFDFEHTNERGARIVARRIYAAIRSTLVAQSERR